MVREWCRWKNTLERYSEGRIYWMWCQSDKGPRDAPEIACTGEHVCSSSVNWENQREAEAFCSLRVSEEKSGIKNPEGGERKLTLLGQDLKGFKPNCLWKESSSNSNQENWHGLHMCPTIRSGAAEPCGHRHLVSQQRAPTLSACVIGLKMTWRWPPCLQSHLSMHTQPPLLQSLLYAVTSMTFLKPLSELWHSHAYHYPAE